MRFQVRDRARSVRVRLAFVSLADRTTYRVNLGNRRTGREHTYAWTRDVAPGAYRVRITARNPRGKKAVRSTTMQVAARTGPGAPRARTGFPSPGAYSWGGAGSRFGAARNGHTHQGQDLAAAEGTPLVAVVDRHDLVARVPGRRRRALPRARRDAEDYNYVYMHLQSGSLLVRKGDRVTIGQHIANVGNTGSSEGPHLHFEIWDGPWYDGGHPVDPYPVPEVWE